MIVFGVKCFQFGRHFTILSDHKPLQQLFKETRATPTMVTACIQRWVQLLGGYDYTITYKPGKQHGNADPLSLLPLPEAPVDVPVPLETIMLMESLSSSPITAAHIKQWTTKDPVLLKVKDFVLRGWHHSKNQGGVSVYYMYRNELSVHDGYLLRRNYVIVPPVGREQGDGSATQRTPRKHELVVRLVARLRFDQDVKEKMKILCDACQRVLLQHHYICGSSPSVPRDFMQISRDLSKARCS